MSYVCSMSYGDDEKIENWFLPSFHIPFFLFSLLAVFLVFVSSAVTIVRIDPTDCLSRLCVCILVKAFDLTNDTNGTKWNGRESSSISFWISNVSKSY